MPQTGERTMIQPVPYIGEPATLPLQLIRTEAQIRTRNGFDQESLSELAASIREVGIIEPIIVRPDMAREGEYIVVAGERRLLAASLANLAEVPVIVRSVDEAQASVLQAVENLQREDLSLPDVADGVAALLAHYKTPKAVAKALGKSAPWVSKHLAIKRMAPAVRDVLTAELSEDVELLLGLDQIVKLRTPEAFRTFQTLAAGLEAGTTTRATVRLALARLKTPAAPDADTEADEAGDGGSSGGIAGAKALQPIAWTVTLDQSRIEKLEALGGRDWLIAQLDKVKV
jgi:ParB/RepB/Spo0J family partition protein